MKEYIRSLREKLGHETIIQCAASIIVIDENGSILLGKRRDNHLWGYAGGSVQAENLNDRVQKIFTLAGLPRLIPVVKEEQDD